jgi:hypothetical protein
VETEALLACLIAGLDNVMSATDTLARWLAVSFGAGWLPGDGSARGALDLRTRLEPAARAAEGFGAPLDAAVLVGDEAWVALPAAADVDAELAELPCAAADGALDVVSPQPESTNQPTTSAGASRRTPAPTPALIAPIAFTDRGCGFGIGPS